ncbi:Glycosyltransferase WbsX [Mucilaginibacter pineti]|uniref:Glycosyltransferase WbsX n=1 Tax=Mucilaginibacter pineti TaxID=1391627 RepID=A0A1G7CQJ8_9SPHI|nr:glycoside hydrolase family 99-like domain-containing protein [Mucilaginibacter pineti]SDE41694.1 Glycosyltransferase WbsX [Mucilaginibacter pineti]
MKRVIFIFTIIAAGLLTSCGSKSTNGEADDITVAVYYFPNYHPGDSRNSKEKGPGWSEWELVKAAKSRFAGHRQPRVPLWGYTNEADPKQMAQKIAAAAANGINAFIFDWYYYDDGPFLEKALEQGFMKAPNNDLLKFSLMWANHDWEEIHPYTEGAPREVLYPGKITPQTWDKMTDMIISRYFKHKSYWLIDGAPYFSVYDLSKLQESFGSVAATAKALADFRKKTIAAGFKDLHLNAVVWGNPILHAEKTVTDPVALVHELGFNSVTSYVWIHHVPLHQQVVPFDTVKKAYMKYAMEATNNYAVPYFPNVSVGWDASPRTDQRTPFNNSGYPYTNTIGENTPAAFESALRDVKQFMQTHAQKVVTINSWNEWTEGSYLEPDTTHRMKYLEAIKAVFGKKQVSAQSK